MENANLDTVMKRLDALKDTMTVSRVFGEAYVADGVTVIPVVSVRGGGGGGGGEGVTNGLPATVSGTTGSGANGSSATGSGLGVGYGVVARPVGVYVIKDGSVTWQPSVDVMKVILGGQILAFFALLTIRRLLKR